jgi:hypothetical protein
MLDIQESEPQMRIWPLSLLLVVAACVGCGTTKFSDTSRTATEQLLISDAMDRAVSQIDLRALAGKTVYLDDAPLKGVVDATYLVSTLRQHILASGCILKEKREEADYILEVRAGAVGTDRHDVLFGVPATNIPNVVAVPGLPNTIPELPLAKKTDQQAVAKIAVFAYNRQTGRPVWQSGIVPGESQAKDLWVFGAGPFQRGSIYEGTNFAGGKLDIPLIDFSKKQGEDRISVADEAYFVEPEERSEPQVAQQPGNQVSQAEPKSQTDEAKPATAGEKPPVVQTGHAALGQTTVAAQPAGTPTAIAPDDSPALISGGSDAAASSNQPIVVPLVNTPPVASAPPVTGGRPLPQTDVLPPTDLSTTPAYNGRSLVLPLPPITPAPEDGRDASILGRLLQFRP